MNARPMEIKGHHVLFAMLGFFAVIIGVNALFMTMAVKTFPGEEVKKSYVQGRLFNEVLAERQAQAELGWRAGVTLATDPSGGPALEVRLIDADGAPLSNLPMTALIRRPATDAYDQSLEMIYIAEGLYRAPLADLGPGRWEALVVAETPAGERFEAHKSLIAK